MSSAKTPSTAPAPISHESSEPKLGPILRFGAVLALLSLAVFFLMYWMFSTEIAEQSAQDAPRPPLSAARQVPPDPRLQSLPGVPLVGQTMPEGMQPFTSTSFSDFQKKQNEELSSYGWIDRQAGIVHIPIDRAIELVLKKGLPASQPQPNKR